MSTKTKIAFEKMHERQKEARKILEEARARGLEAVGRAVLYGNRFVLDVISGKHLALGVERFQLQEDEIRLVLACLDEMDRRERRTEVKDEALGSPDTIRGLHRLGLLFPGRRAK